MTGHKLVNTPHTVITLRGLAVALALVCSGSATAQTSRQPASERPLFSEGVTVVEVEVPVQVLVDGKPVRGLGAEDFLLFDRGELREISDFEVFDLSRSAALEQTLGEIPRTLEEAQRIAARRSLLALFDFRYNSLGYAARAVTALRTLVDEQMAPSDRVAIAVLGGRRGAQMVVGFSRDKERLRRALDLVDALADLKPKRQREAAAALRATLPKSRSEWIDAYGPAAVAAFGQDLQTVTIHANPTMDTGLATAFDGIGAYSAGISEAFELGNSIRSIEAFRNAELFAESLGNLGTLLKSVSGQKHALLFSQGPPSSTLVTASGRNRNFGAQRVAQAMEQMIEQLGRSGWKIHTFGQGMGFSDSLFYLANETGGTAFENRGRLVATTVELLEQTSVTYVLHFVASGIAIDGRRHALEVRLVDPPKGAKLRHRPHYFAPEPPGAKSEIERRIEQAERQLDELRNRIKAELVVFTLGHPPEARSYLLVQIPNSELRRFDSEGKVSIELLAQQANEWPQDLLRLRIEMDRKELGNWPRDGLVVLGDLALTDSEALIRVALRSGGLQTDWRLDGGATPEGNSRPLPPLFLASGTERLLLREGEEAPVQSPLKVRGHELVPQPLPRVSAGQPLGVSLWLLYQTDATKPPPMHSLLRDLSRGTAARDVLQVGERRTIDHHLSVLATLSTQELSPGRYSLEVRWEGVPGVGTGTFEIVGPGQN